MQPKKVRTRTLVENHVRFKHYIILCRVNPNGKGVRQDTLCASSHASRSNLKHIFGRLHIYTTNSGGTPDPPGGEDVLRKIVGEGLDHSKPQIRASCRVAINTVLSTRHNSWGVQARKN